MDLSGRYEYRSYASGRRATRAAGQRMRRRREIPSSVEDEVSRIFASWNQLDGWLRQVDGLRRVA